MAKEQSETIRGNGHVAIHDWSPVDERGHHKTPDRIEQDIEETRNTMDVLLDSFTGRFNPRSLADRVTGYFRRPENREKAKEAARRVGNGISESFKKNPLPAMMITSGAAWMLWESLRHDGRERGQMAQLHTTNEQPEFGEEVEGPGESVKEKAAGAFETAKEKSREGFESARESLSSGAERAKEKVEEMRSKAMEAGESVKHRVGDLSTKASDSVKRSTRSVNRTVHENPLMVGAAAVLAGIVAGMMIPSSPQEKRVMGEEARKTIDKVKEGAQETWEQGKQVAQSAFETTKEEAQRMGFTPEDISAQVERKAEEPGSPKEKAKGAADDVASRAARAAEEAARKTEQNLGDEEA